MPPNNDQSVYGAPAPQPIGPTPGPAMPQPITIAQPVAQPIPPTPYVRAPAPAQIPVVPSPAQQPVTAAAFVDPLQSTMPPGAEPQPAIMPAPVQAAQNYAPQEQYAAPQLRPITDAVQQAHTKGLHDKDDLNRYDFFLKNEAQPARSSLLPIKRGMSTFSKVLIGAAAFGVVLAVLAIVLSVSRKSDSSAVGYLAVIQTQQEITRISGLAGTKVGATYLQNFATTASTTTPAAQTQLIEYYKKHGGKVDSKALAATTNAKTDQALDAASAAGTYDSTFKSIMTDLLNSYKTGLQQANATTTSSAGKTLLKQDFTSAGLLQTMLSADPSGTNGTGSSSADGTD